MARGQAAAVQLEGRDIAAAAIDQPKLTQGTWVHGHEVVVERSFADALRVGVGDTITLDRRPSAVAGVAVTAAEPPYPRVLLILAARAPRAGGAAEAQPPPG